MKTEKSTQNTNTAPNEIELKVILSAKTIPTMTQWLATLNTISHATETLENRYYDTNTFYFEQHQMGLRIRTKNNKHQLTLKTKGDIIGGLHIRPEYNLDLTDNTPDFKRLVTHYNLPFNDSAILNAPLIATFSTDFTRQKQLINYKSSQIEIALDQGLIKNQYGQETICELEFELKTGSLTDLFYLLDEMPKTDGMWLSSLSKAQRGYLVGNTEKIAKEVAQLTACHHTTLTEIEHFQLTQQLADFIRLTEDTHLINYYQQLTGTTLTDINQLRCQLYFEQILDTLKSFYL